MKKYQCISCGETSTDKEWNKATFENYESNQARLPEAFIKVEGIDTIEEMNALISTPDYNSDADLPAFTCPACGFSPMANELIEVVPKKMIGDKYYFNTHGQDSKLNCESGKVVTIISALTADECDIEEVGMMYKVQLLDGKIIDAFDDELRFAI